MTRQGAQNHYYKKIQIQKIPIPGSNLGPLAPKPKSQPIGYENDMVLMEPATVDGVVVQPVWMGVNATKLSNLQFGKQEKSKCVFRFLMIVYC